MQSENEMYQKYDYHAYRVRVDKVNHARSLALCFYIDDGYTEWLTYDIYLYQFNTNLLKYPAQAIHFNLYDVLDFKEDAFACKGIYLQMLVDKQFMAKIKQAQFEEQATKIGVILYSMSTGVGRNVNKCILQKIHEKIYKLCWI